ncbi:unnamed protein product [Dibothriocephalus latus]|uniref:Uncharacterized protein n=1 Tax=Dibothriocephalus latus TaxID=60516 RepID=A0A3P7RB35_DIBLA|nr:unnamed protein product [Dibothriocephalus latus]
MSYWKCEWVSELQLDVFHPIMLRVFFKKYDMEEPPPPEDGSTYRAHTHQSWATVRKLNKNGPQ